MQSGRPNNFWNNSWYESYKPIPMKKISLILIIISFISCKKDENLTDSIVDNSIYIIDKVYDYHNRQIAEYVYNEKNQLILRRTTDSALQRYSDYNLEYKDDLLNKISYEDYTFPQFSHQIYLQYDNQKKVIREETFKSNQMISYNNYHYNSEGKIDYFMDDAGKGNFYIYYNQQGDVITSKYIIDVSQDPMHQGKDTIHAYRYFKYDQNNSPKTNLNDLIQFEILPYYGTEATIEKALSAHNMTEMVNGTKWIYTYNSQGLPETIEVKWKDVNTLEPIMWRIKYKKIQK